MEGEVLQREEEEERGQEFKARGQDSTNQDQARPGPWEAWEAEWNRSNPLCGAWVGG